MSDYRQRFSVEGKRALVTGASKGLGAEIAVVLASAGADLVITGRDQDGLAATVAQVKATGRAVASVVADLRTVEGANHVIAETLRIFGGLDILVNNAGIARIRPLLEGTVDEWDETMAVNLRAPYLLARGFAPAMMAQHRGKIINVSSMAGSVALPGHVSYSSSKAGLDMLTKMLALELGPYNIQVTGVAPTVILTQMGIENWSDPARAEPMLAKIPLHRFGQPVEVADLVLFLASPASDMITAETVLIDGGYVAV